MKAARSFMIMVASLAFLSGCDRASPEGDISCSSGQAFTVDFEAGDAGLVSRFLVVKGVTISDPGIGGEFALNGAKVDLVTNYSTIGVCKGNCLDGTGSLETTLEVETDDDGILLYTIGAAFGSYTGAVAEIFSSTGSCKTDVTATVAE